MLVRACEQRLRSGIEIAVGEESVPVREDIFPPLVHCSQKTSAGAVVHLQGNQPPPAVLDLGPARCGQVTIGRIEGDPSH